MGTAPVPIPGGKKLEPFCQPSSKIWGGRSPSSFLRLHFQVFPVAVMGNRGLLGPAPTLLALPWVLPEVPTMIIPSLAHLVILPPHSGTGVLGFVSSEALR